MHKENTDGFNGCTSDHEEIMREFDRIHKRMDDDWKLIDAANKDLEFRRKLWDIVRVIGFGTVTGLVVKLFEHL